MNRWPMRNAVPVSPYEMGYTIPTEVDLKTKRRTNNHHAIFPWANVVGNEILRTYASLRTHVFPMLAIEHNVGNFNLHSEFDPPKLPRLGEAADVVDEYLALNGIIDCVCHKKTINTYQITEEQWTRIRGRYAI